MIDALVETQPETVRKRVQLHDGQTAIFKTDARFIGLIAGTGGGKTWVGPYWLAKQIQHNPQGLYGIGAPTYKMLNRVTAPELVKAFRGTTLEGDYMPSVGEYRLPTGGLIYLFSTDNPDHVEGGQYDAIWLDEAGQMKAWIWVVVQARLGFKQGKLLLTTTPYGLNWLHTDIFIPARRGDKDYFVSQFASTDNPQYPKAEFERARKTMDERTFAMRYMGEFRKMAGLVWPDLSSWICQLDEATEAHRKAQEAPDSVRWVGGIDWGYNNPFAALSGFVDSDDVLWVYQERCQARTLLGDHAAALDKRTTYHADPSGKQETEEMVKLGVTVQPAINDVAMGIERVTNRGKDGRLRISPQCKNLISEAETYRYKEETDKPVKENDHTCLVANTSILTPHGSKRLIDLKIGDVVVSHKGWATVEVGPVQTGIKPLLSLTLSDMRNILCTGEHPIATHGGGWVDAKDSLGMEVDTWAGNIKDRASWWNSMACDSTDTLIPQTWKREDITRRVLGTGKGESVGCIEKSGNIITAKYPKVATSIIGMGILSITTSAILYWSIRKNIQRLIPLQQSRKPRTKNISIALDQKRRNGIGAKREGNGIGSMLSTATASDLKGLTHVPIAERSLVRSIIDRGQGIAQVIVEHTPGEIRALIMNSESALSVVRTSLSIVMQRRNAARRNVQSCCVQELSWTGQTEPVYSIATSDGTYFANGILVSNCDTLRYMVMGVDGKPEPMVISLNYADDVEEDIILSDDPRYWRQY